jgi:hypothetical protein
MHSAPHPVELVRHENIVYVDLLRGALESAGLHPFTREETFAGLKLALPVMPTAQPGIQFVLLVPSDEVTRAREVIAQLPFDTQTFCDARPWMHLPTVPKIIELRKD